MNDYELEREFQTYKEEHQKRILQAKITAYYIAKEASGIRIPFFITKTPEKKAEEDVNRLFKQAPHAFEQLYERAWYEIAECLP